MKHSIKVQGFSYSLRPVELSDAQFIIDTRREDSTRNRFIHETSPNVQEQEEWILRYFEREGDYYFVIENMLLSKPEGLVGIYDIKDGRGEWGRWVLQKGSLAAIESIDLMCRAAFDRLGMSEIYSRTVEDNTQVVSFHNSAKEKFRGVLHNSCQINGAYYNQVEHYIPADYYRAELAFDLQKKAQLVFTRNMRLFLGNFTFHHIGYACADFEKETAAFRMLGFRQKDADFIDETQGIHGRFLAADGQPEIELLKNLDGSKTLDHWLDRGTSMYHLAYTTKKFDEALEHFRRMRCVISRQPEHSAYFGKRICFLMLPNMLMIELIEEREVL